MPHLEFVTLVVREYDPAIEFFVNVLEFDSSSPGEWAYSFGLTISIRLTRASLLRVCSLLRRRAQSLTDVWQCFATSNAIAGTCWGPRLAPNNRTRQPSR
jgi:hypothetical protein